MKKNRDWTPTEIELLVSLKLAGQTWEEIAKNFDGVTPNSARKAFYRYTRDDAKPRGSKSAPKVLLFDIETAPIEAYVWDIWNQNVGLEQIKKDWSILSFAAKWMHEDKVMYLDNRDQKDPRDDRHLLPVLASLLEEADIVIGQNSDKFDLPKIKARMLLNKMQPFTEPKSIDTYKILKRFGLTSKKLAYTTDKLCTRYKKLTHKEFPGQSLWNECLKHNLKAWKEMEAYNKHDVLSLEELYVDHLAKWDDTLNFAAFTTDLVFRCNCGSDQFTRVKDKVTKKSRFARYKCKVCGKEHRDSSNLFTKEERAKLKV